MNLAAVFPKASNEITKIKLPLLCGCIQVTPKTNSYMLSIPIAGY